MDFCILSPVLYNYYRFGKSKSNIKCELVLRRIWHVCDGGFISVVILMVLALQEKRSVLSRNFYIYFGKLFPLGLSFFLSWVCGRRADGQLKSSLLGLDCTCEHGLDAKVCKHSRESQGREIACLLSKTTNDDVKFHKLNPFSEKQYENDAKIRRWQFPGKQKYTLVSGHERYMSRSPLFRLQTRNELLS